jgi:hypothetical protein
VRQKARKGRITCRTKNRGPWSKAKSTSEIVLCQQPRTKKHTHIFKQLGPWVFFWGTGGAPSAERKYRTLNLRNQQYPAIAPPGGGQKGGSTPFPTRCRGHPTAGVTLDKQSAAGGIEPPATEQFPNCSRLKGSVAIPSDFPRDKRSCPFNHRFIGSRGHRAPCYRGSFRTAVG